jgi:hypothetical protein
LRNSEKSTASLRSSLVARRHLTKPDDDGFASELVAGTTQGRPEGVESGWGRWSGARRGVHQHLAWNTPFWHAQRRGVLCGAQDGIKALSSAGLRAVGKQQRRPPRVVRRQVHIFATGLS